MCIICIKPAGVDMPTDRTVSYMWQQNPDGAGLAYSRPGDSVVELTKGFMKLKALKGALTKLALGKDDLVVLHFRWATHGLKDQGNCHPFPLSSKIEALRAIYGQFPCVIAHNGVFGSMPTHKTLSDTQKFISKVLCNPAVVNNLENPAVQELIRGYCGYSSKLAVLKPGKLSLIGEFEKDSETGLVYSNDGYEPQWSGGYSQNCAVENNVVEYYEGKTYGKQCELCQKEQDISYIDIYDLFLCKHCLKLNMEIDKIDIEGNKV